MCLPVDFTVCLRCNTAASTTASWGAQVIEVENPNAQQKSSKNMKIKDMDAAAEPAPLSRRVSVCSVLL
jgi:crotonobetainyl-CoA:carnitine CoA-transferase CaiB-like acyl-CoA transferase